MSDLATGRGLVYAFGSRTVVAVMCELGVNRKAVHIWGKRVVECGTLHVKLGADQVTGVERATYATLRHQNTPGAVFDATGVGRSSVPLRLSDV